MFAPADSWTLPSHLYLVSGVVGDVRNPHDPMSCTSDLSAERGDRQGARRTDRRSTVDRHHATPLRARRRVGVLRRRRHVHRPALPRRHDETTAGSRTRSPGFTTVHADAPGREHPDARALLHAAAGRHAALGLVGHAGARPSASTRPATDRDGQAYVTRVVNAVMRGPRLEPHGDLPDLGRLGRLLRPREPPIRVDENGYGIRVPGILISPFAERGRSTTRRSASTPT